jgi:hypothetical protein
VATGQVERSGDAAGGSVELCGLAGEAFTLTMFDLGDDGKLLRSPRRVCLFHCSRRKYSIELWLL